MTAEHLDEGTMQQLLHDELPATMAAAVRAHASACAECRERLTRAHHEEADLFHRLTALDDPTPLVTSDHIVTGSGAKPAGRRGTGAQRGAWRWAAGVLLAIGISGVAYAAPGSPLRWVVGRISAWIRTPATNPDRDTTVPAVPPAGGVLVEPGRHTVIELRTVQPSDTLRVMLGDAKQIIVRSFGGSVTFDAELDRLAVNNVSGVAAIEVVIPRTAPRVEIISGGRQLYLKDGPAITSIALDTTGGRYVILPARR